MDPSQALTLWKNAFYHWHTLCNGFYVELRLICREECSYPSTLQAGGAEDGSARSQSGPSGGEGSPMQVIVSMNNQGEVFVATPKGHIVTACFFKAEDETADELRQMGYQPLVERYPPTQIRVGTGIDPEDLAELFVDA